MVNCKILGSISINKKTVISVLIRKDNNFNYKNYVFKIFFERLLAISHWPLAYLLNNSTQNIGILLDFKQLNLYNLVDILFIVWNFDF